jgi:hypothetical protein
MHCVIFATRKSKLEVTGRYVTRLSKSIVCMTLAKINVAAEAKAYTRA